MATTGLNYSKLSDDAKEVALNSFINFYVDQYHRGSLEILSSQVSNELMATINQILRSEERRVGKECRSRWSPYH